MEKKRLKGIVAAGFAVVMLALTGPAWAQGTCEPLTGAIFTTDAGGNLVNGNIYFDKEDVYLNGGPLKAGAAGLPDGWYYYQVTDPSGSTLLSTEGIGDRLIEVVDGEFADLVQLAPFGDTPNAGGVYKVWVTSVACYHEGGGFAPPYSKTDNFRVWSEDPDCHATICGHKFYDADADGAWDKATEPYINGWLIVLREGDIGGPIVDFAFTGEIDGEGEYCFQVCEAGVYVVEEVMPLGNWVQTAPASPAYFEITVVLDNNYLDNDFGNVCCTPGTGGLTIGYWQNKNGQALINGGDISVLNGLGLLKPAGWSYPPFSSTLATAKGQIKTYLNSATAIDMRWMLSAQLIATKLCLQHGSLTGSTLVHVGVSSYVPTGFITIDGIVAGAVGALAKPHPANRMEQEYWKSLLDGLNNNTLYFVCPAPCQVIYED